MLEDAAEADLSLRNTIRHLTLHASRGRVEERDGVFLFAGACETAHPYVNGVIRTDGGVPAASVVDAARSFFKDSGRSFGLWASAHADEDILELAAHAGLYSHRPEGSPGMMLEHDPERVDRMPVEIVDSGATQAAFVGVTERAYEHAMTPEVTRAIFGELAVLCGPNVKAFVAREGGLPVAAAMITVYDGLGEVGFVGTVPEARGRGLGLLVTQACAYDAFAGGARRVFLQASAMGEPVYRKLGFVEVTRYVKFEVPELSAARSPRR